MNESNAVSKAFSITWIVTIVVAIPLWIFVNSMWAYSFVLGSATTLMMMSIMVKSSKKVLEEQNPNASKIVVRNYIFRYLFYGLILAVAALSDGFEIIAVAIGLFSFKVALYIALWLEKRGDKHD